MNEKLIKELRKLNDKERDAVFERALALTIKVLKLFKEEDVTLLEARLLLVVMAEGVMRDDFPMKGTAKNG